MSKKPSPLIDGFEWTTLDIENANQRQELYDLLVNHYVEDDTGIFRFNYSVSFLEWYVDPSTAIVQWVKV